MSRCGAKVHRARQATLHSSILMTFALAFHLRFARASQADTDNSSTLRVTKNNLSKRHQKCKSLNYDG
jgi:hypothetical protein